MTKKNEFKLTLILSFEHTSEDVVELQDHINNILDATIKKKMRTVMELILSNLEVEKYTLKMRTELC